MTGTCAVKRGFFVLRDCGSSAASQCSICQRPICYQHMVTRGTTNFCVECNARQLSEEEKRARLQDPEDDVGFYAYRSGFYNRYGYSPFYSGLYYDSYYDEYDLRSFANAGDDSVGRDDDSGVAGFTDS